MIEVYDFYEGKDFVGYSSNIEDAAKLLFQRLEDTDGECEVACILNGDDVTEIVCAYIKAHQKEFWG